MSIREVARRMFRKSIRRCAPPLREFEQLEGRENPSGLNLSAALMPSTLDVLLTGSVSSSPEAMSSVSFSVQWGDGQSSMIPYSFTPASGMCPVSSSHTYLSAGTYTVSVMASAVYASATPDSATGTYSVTVQTTTVPPPPTSPPPGPPPSPPSATVRIETVRDTGEALGSETGQFNIVRYGGDLTQPLTVSYTIAGTASPLMDYQSLPGSVTFAANASTATISVTTMDDLIWDPNETIVATLANGPGYSVLTPAGLDTIVINDNDIDAINDSTTRWVDNAATIAVLGNDLVTGATTVSGVTQPMHGTVTINADGTLFYVPNVGYIGTDTFNYTATNDIGGTDMAQVSVTLMEAVIALDDSATTDSDAAVTISVLSNDIGASLILSVVQPSHGSVAISGNTLVYTPSSGYAGTDSFEYTISGGQSQTSSATVDVFTRGKINGVYWFDENEDGMLNNDEPNVMGVHVELIDSDGGLVAFTDTDGQGRYTFATSKLPDGLFKLHFQDANLISAYSNVEYTLQNVSAPSGVVVSAANADGWTGLFQVGLLQPPAKKDAGVKAKPVNVNGKGDASFALKKLEGIPSIQGKNLVTNKSFFARPTLVDQKQNAYALTFDSYDAKTDVATGLNGTFAIKVHDLAIGYTYGVDTVGQFVEAGYANKAPVASDAYYWGQYIKIDKSETAAAPGSFDAFYGVRPDGVPPPDGKWYLDAKQQFAWPGLKNSYIGQALNSWHPMWDTPASHRQTEPKNLTIYGKLEATPAVFPDPSNKGGVIVYIGYETRDKAAEADVKAVLAKNGNKAFTLGYANTFETYIVQKAQTVPLGFYSWDWSLSLSSATKSYSVVVHPGEGEAAPWTTTPDAAVWDKAQPYAPPP